MASWPIHEPSRAITFAEVPRTEQQGFTLLEMLAAMAILAIGITSLLGALSAGLSTRRSAEQRNRAALLADQVIVELRTRGLATLGEAGEADVGDEEIAPIIVTGIEGYPGMKYSVRFVTDPEHSDLILARIRISWMHQGDDVGVEFLRLLPRSPTLSQRVEKRIEQQRNSP